MSEEEKRKRAVAYFREAFRHQMKGDTDKAIETFTEVYGIDVNYRKVGDKIKQLRATKT